VTGVKSVEIRSYTERIGGGKGWQKVYFAVNLSTAHLSEKGLAMHGRTRTEGRDSLAMSTATPDGGFSQKVQHRLGGSSGLKDLGNE